MRMNRDHRHHPVAWFLLRFILTIQGWGWEDCSSETSSVAWQDVSSLCLPILVVSTVFLPIFVVKQ